MKLRTRIIAIVAAGVLAFMGWAVPAALAGGGGGGGVHKAVEDSADYWQKKLPAGTQCYRHEGSGGEHGKAEGDTVKLNKFDAKNWHGDRWELLVVFDKNGHKEYPTPAAGAYKTPTGKDVTSWIACKGTTPKDVCKEWPAAPSGITVGKDCTYVVSVCWQLNTNVPDLGNYDLKTLFPQTPIKFGPKFTDVYNHCDNIPVDICEDIVQYQVDEYSVESKGDAKRLKEILNNGLGFNSYKDGQPDDSILYVKHKFIENKGDTCDTPPTFVDYCVWDADKGEATKQQLEEGVTPPAGWVKWTDSSTVPDGCAPVVEYVDYCVWDSTNNKANTVTIEKGDNPPAGWFEIPTSGELPAGCYPPPPEVVQYCVWDSASNTYSFLTEEKGKAVPSNWYQTTQTDVVPDGCIPPTITICELGADNTWGESADIYEEDLPTSYTKWTGNAEDCFDFDGSVDLCHADTTGAPFSAVNSSYGATFTGGDWEFSFNGHQSHGADYIPPFDATKHGINASYPGNGNWLAKFDGAGGTAAWADFLANDCADPIDTSVQTASNGGICEAPNGDYTYTVTLGSFAGSHEFFIEAAGATTAQSLGTVQSNGTATFTDSAVAPGDYTIYGVATGSTTPAADLTYAFTIETPADCGDIDGTVLGGICTADIPYLGFTVVLDDPYGDVVLPNDAQVEFINDKNADGNVTIELDLRKQASYTDANGVEYTYSVTGTTHTWTGRTLWPGAEVDADGAPIGWAGWDVVDGELTNVGLENYGWTRGGVDITVSVNPDVTIEGVEYPAMTPLCDEPPNDTPPEDTPPEDPEDDDFTIVAGVPPLAAAPPAVPVVAEATFAG